MNEYKNILLIHPCDKQTISHAARLLRSNHSKLTVLHIVPELDHPKALAADGKEIDLQKLFVNEYQDELEQLIRPLKDSGLRVYPEVVVGTPFLEAIRQVIAKKHDLVVMTADGHIGLREQLFGTTSKHMMRKCPCPVWVIKPTRRKKLRKVIAAVDPDTLDETRDSLNAEILRHAESVAEMDGAEIHIVHAWTTFGGDASRNRRWMTAAEIRLYVEQVANEHRQRLDKLVKEHLRRDPTRVHVIQGKPGVVIPEIVDSENGDLLVMGTVCRTGIQGFFIGNTAEMVLSEVDCSVLTIKPRGFVSPVKLD